MRSPLSLGIAFLLSICPSARAGIETTVDWAVRCASLAVVIAAVNSVIATCEGEIAACTMTPDLCSTGDLDAIEKTLADANNALVRLLARYDGMGCRFSPTSTPSGT